MKGRHLVGVIGLAAVLATGTGAALAGGKHGGWDKSGGLHAAYRVDDLTPEQHERIDALRENLREDRAQWREDKRALKEAMREGADVETVRPLAEKQGQRVTDRIMKRARARAELAEILTPDQMAQLKDKGRRCDRRGW